jgi:ABC-type uncharacterized transport system auxiliary subunit
MKSMTYRILAAIILAASLCGCGTIQPESAMQWMARQPWDTLP